MKKFRVEKTLKTNSGSIRLGHLQLPVSSSGVVEDGDKKRSSERKNDYGTPMFFLHTQTGSIPHITAEVLQLIYPTSTPSISSQTPPVQISLDSTTKFMDALKKFGKGVGKFVGLSDYPIFLTVHDPLYLLRSGHNDKFGIALWSRHGRRPLSPQQYHEAATAFKPSICQVLSDYDVNPKISGTKRLQKSLDRAEEYTSCIIKQQETEPKNEALGLFITVEASWFQMDEGRATKTVLKLLESQHQIEGVVLAGLTDRFPKKDVEVKKNPSGKGSSGERERVDICQALDVDLLEKILQTLPPGLPKYIPGPLRIPEMMDLIAKGVDIFDSSVASRMADDAEVFLLDSVEALLPSISSTVVKLSSSLNEGLPERESNEKNQPSREDEEGAVVSLKNKKYFDDFGPLSSFCVCYTCRKHTRSYIHHLYATDELLGPVLIQIHNLTALDRFFSIMRTLIKECDTPESLQTKLDLIRNLLNNRILRQAEEEEKVAVQAHV
ncbi:Queuine tRNA-ribosyltransferase subunit qtrtd1 [Orchesella cincta]|uniref:Queuine tRNA-ribosyltransferase accessory subunit 2 n=1 Tax=Orchesella cincta TaxID=48709 RepID=A0A1D2NE78_ORCCI|nr:Queuine tRNA-ribosyltransferase subunit qtrtd1 [Orchesella cincta]